MKALGMKLILAGVLAAVARVAFAGCAGLVVGNVATSYQYLVGCSPGCQYAAAGVSGLCISNANYDVLSGTTNFGAAATPFPPFTSLVQALSAANALCPVNSSFVQTN